jgi:hypothetical protein
MRGARDEKPLSRRLMVETFARIEDFDEQGFAMRVFAA